MKIDIPGDFSPRPGARFRSQGPDSGEQFYEEWLYPKYLASVEADEKLEVYFDGALGYPPSFLDESFGRLAREYGIETVCDRLVLHYSSDPRGTDRIWKIIRDPRNRRKAVQ